MNVSAIIPTYRNPAYLDICVRSAVENRKKEETEIIVIVDGYYEESETVLAQYKDISVIALPKNTGMQNALNLGVMNAMNPFVFIVNDDNVFPTAWDTRLTSVGYEEVLQNIVVTVNQVEPSISMFHFVEKDLGQDAESFRYHEWLEYEKMIASTSPSPTGRLFPFLISKRWYSIVGGFDTYYKSPFWCDVDFWLKLELTHQLAFMRTRKMHLYHFGSVSTKKRPGLEGDQFRQSEMMAANQFLYKWGYLPNMVGNVARNNTKFPDTPVTFKGITFP